MSQFYLHNELFHPKLNITTYTIKVIRKLHLKIKKKTVLINIRHAQKIENIKKNKKNLKLDNNIILKINYSIIPKLHFK